MAAPSGISPIVEESIKMTGLTLVQGQPAKKVSSSTSCVWETLPITEKGKDEIDFSCLSEEVRSDDDNLSHCLVLPGED